MTTVEVKVMVEEGRLAEFYSFLGQWMAGGTQSDLAIAGKKESLTLSPWTQQDLGLAQELWGKFPARAKAMCGLLIDSPGVKLSAAEIGSSLDIPNGINGVAGVLAWPGRYSTSMGKELPVQKEDGEPGEGANYWIEEDVAALFAKARSEAK